MSPRKREEATEPFDYDEALAKVRQTMAELHLPRFEELPRIELYLDQVLSIVSAELAPLYDEGERIITGSMVNNYVKQRVVPAPARKRYTRGHLTRLLVVCVLKRVLPIPQVGQLLALCGEVATEPDILYDRFCDLLEQTLAERFRVSSPTASAPAASPAAETELEQLLMAAVELVADRVYLERMLSLESRRDHLS